MSSSLVKFILPVLALGAVVSAMPAVTPPSSDREYVCDSKAADVIFLLDESNSIWRPHFNRQLKRFVKSIIGTFLIGDANIRVGAVTYSNEAISHFGLQKYDSNFELDAAVEAIHQTGGYYTRTYDAIEYMREIAFSPEKGARPDVIKVGIVITDGQSDNTEQTIAEAEKAHLAGIHVFAIGVGYNIDQNELRGIASKPSDHYTFLVTSYDGLDNIKKTLAIKACQVTDPPTTPPPRIRFETKPSKVVELTTTPGNQALEGPDRGDEELHGCTPKQPLDVAFIVDQKQGGSENRKHLWKLVRETIAQLSPEDNDITISFIQECSDIPEMKLSDYSDKNSILAQLDSINTNPYRTPGLLRSMTDTFREHAQNLENLDRHRVGIYITDGSSNDIELTLREAQEAKLNEEVEMIGIGVTDSVSKTELNALVSCEPEDHFLTAGTHRDAHKLHKQLAKLICRAEPRVRPTTVEIVDDEL